MSLKRFFRRRPIKGLRKAHEITLTVRGPSGSIVVNKTVVIQSPRFGKKGKVLV